jgi:hypothetical protein
MVDFIPNKSKSYDLQEGEDEEDFDESEETQKFSSNKKILAKTGII